MNQKAPKLLKINVILFLLAACVAGYMVYHHYEIITGEQGFNPSFCRVSKTVDCDVVNSSVYSELAGIPLATFALAFYLFTIALSVIAIRNVYSRREALLSLFALSGGSVLVSLTTFYLSFGVLKVVCLMCGFMQVTNIVTFGLTAAALRDFLGTSTLGREVGQLDRKRVLTYAASGLALFVVTWAATSQLNVDRFPLKDAEAFVNEFRAQKPVKIEVGDSPSQGFQGPNPPLQLVEFADFQCPACGWAARFMHLLLPKYADKIQLIFKNFPLDPSCNPFVHVDMHPNACIAAKAGYCAKKQGKFTEMYEKLFGHQTELSRDNINAWAGEIGLDMKAFDDCIPSDETLNAIRADTRQGNDSGLESTPTFFVNGRMVKGAINEARLKLLLKEFGQ